MFETLPGNDYSLFWSEHVGGNNPSVKLLVRDSVFFCRLPERGSLLVRVLGDGGGLIISDVEVQSGDKHERLVEELIDSVFIRGNADDAVINKGVACSSDEIRRSEDVGDHDGLVDVELEVAVHTASGDSHVVAHNLRADHRNGLDLGRVNLARHDGRSGFVLGKVELAETASRSGSEKSHVVGNFVDGAGDDVQSAGSLNHGVVVGERLELVWRGDEWKTSVVGELFAASFGETDSGVKSGADSGAADSELVDSRQTGLDSDRKSVV